MNPADTGQPKQLQRFAVKYISLFLLCRELAPLRVSEPAVTSPLPSPLPSSKSSLKSHLGSVCSSTSVVAFGNTDNGVVESVVSREDSTRRSLESGSTDRCKAESERVRPLALFLLAADRVVPASDDVTVDNCFGWDLLLRDITTDTVKEVHAALQYAGEQLDKRMGKTRHGNNDHERIAELSQMFSKHRNLVDCFAACQGDDGRPSSYNCKKVLVELNELLNDCTPAQQPRSESDSQYYCYLGMWKVDRPRQPSPFFYGLLLDDDDDRYSGMTAWLHATRAYRVMVPPVKWKEKRMGGVEEAKKHFDFVIEPHSDVRSDSIAYSICRVVSHISLSPCEVSLIGWLLCVDCPSNPMSFRFNETYRRMEPLGKGAYGTVHKLECDGGKFFAKKTLNKAGPMKLASSLNGRSHLLVPCKRRPKSPSTTSNIQASVCMEIVTHFLVSYGSSEHMVKLRHCELGRQHPSLIMELCDGSLRKLIKSNLACKDIMNVIKGVFLGVKHMHDCGVMHRDIKGANVLFIQKEDGSYVTRLADCGLSIFKAFLPYDRASVGTRGYQAPEVVLQREYNESADIWSLGVAIPEVLQLSLAHRYLEKHRLKNFYAGHCQYEIPLPIVFANNFMSPSRCYDQVELQTCIEKAMEVSRMERKQNTGEERIVFVVTQGVRGGRKHKSSSLHGASEVTTTTTTGSQDTPATGTVLSSGNPPAAMPQFGNAAVTADEESVALGAWGDMSPSLSGVQARGWEGSIGTRSMLDSKGTMELSSSLPAFRMPQLDGIPAVTADEASMEPVVIAAPSVVWDTLSTLESLEDHPIRGGRSTPSETKAANITTAKKRPLSIPLAAAAASFTGMESALAEDHLMAVAVPLFVDAQPTEEVFQAAAILPTGGADDILSVSDGIPQLHVSEHTVHTGLVELFEEMLAFRPPHRITIHELLDHPVVTDERWVSDVVNSVRKLLSEMESEATEYSKHYNLDGEEN